MWPRRGAARQPPDRLPSSAFSSAAARALSGGGSGGAREARGSGRARAWWPGAARKKLHHEARWMEEASRGGWLGKMGRIHGCQSPEAGGAVPLRCG